MGDPDKPDLARTEELVEKEADRLAKMSAEDFEREMRASLSDPPSVPTMEELRARASARASKAAQKPETSEGHASSAVVAQASARSRTTLWTGRLVAATFVLVVVVLVAKRREVATWFTHEGIGSDHSARDSEPSREKRAAALRIGAFEACGRELWTQCEDELNEAKALDPAGDVTARVLAAHKAALDGMSRELRRRGPDKK